jgi:hypothetical protein
MKTCRQRVNPVQGQSYLFNWLSSGRLWSTSLPSNLLPKETGFQSRKERLLKNVELFTDSLVLGEISANAGIIKQPT